MTKPLLIYDGDCSFCKLWIARWEQITKDSIEYEPYQTAAQRFPEIPHEKFTKSVQLITEDNEILDGAYAVVCSLAYDPTKRWMLWIYDKIPLVGTASEWCYGIIARHRDVAYKLTCLLWGKNLEQPSYLLTRWLFLRLMGLIYLVAFLSLGTQISGLVGKNGILPVEHFFELVKQNFGNERYLEFPTLAWLNSSDTFLQFLCWGGAGLSLLLIFGLVPACVCFMLWVFYLSLFVAGQTFLSFQWDLLLLEAGFLTIFLAPGSLLPKISSERIPSTVIIWLFRLLLFRLMFFSGFVKLASGDPTWRNLTTLTFHYETQPLPTPLAWYAHHLPSWFHTVSCVVMFGIELVIPFLIFLPRRPRSVAFLSFSFFMIMIIITGNYTFFNFLAIALSVLLLDDAALRRFFPKKFSDYSAIISPIRLKRIAVAVVAVMIIFLNVFQFTKLLSRQETPKMFGVVAEWFAPFSIVNRYGLFAVMTNPRNEIVIEGSDDAVMWKEYEFKYKPGDIHRAPGWVAPHQPRLDWQMWFAALGSYRSNPWFIGLCVRLLQGTPEVLQLLEKNPFPDHPPKYLRAELYEYHFTDPETRHATGAWWRRELKGAYLPVISLNQ